MAARDRMIAGFASLLVLGAAVLPAPAAVIAVDSFDSYSSGSLNGDNGGSGWSGAWTGSSLANVVSPGLSGSGALQFGNGSNMADNANLALRSFSSQTGDIYFSFQIRFSNLDIGTSDDFFVLWLDNGSSNGSHSDTPNLGVRGTGFFARLANSTGTTFSTGEESLENDVVYTIVGRLYKDGSTYNHFSLWMDPSFEDSATPLGTAAISSGTKSAITRIGFRSALVEGNEVFQIDSLIFGSTWNDVVAVPEPSTVALAAAGVAGLFFAAARKRSSRSVNRGAG